MKGRYAVMWSGGKDGALAALRVRAAGGEIGRLINLYDRGSGRVRFHATRAEVIAAQAAAAGIELRAYATTWEEYEPTFRAALADLARDGFSGVVFGNIHLADVRAWFEERVVGAGLVHVDPLWGEAPTRLLDELVASGTRAVITCCESAKLPDTWLGRVIDERFAHDIAATGIDPCGENGEYHSFAFAGPLFREPLRWRRGERRDEAGFAQLDIEVAWVGTSPLAR